MTSFFQRHVSLAASLETAIWTADGNGVWEHGGRGFRAGRSELSAARSTFQYNKTKETTSRWEKDVLGSMAIHVMTYVVKGEERER